MRSGPTLKYQLAIDIQVSSTASRFDSFSSSRPDSFASDGRADSSSARAIAEENLRMGGLRVWDGGCRRGPGGAWMRARGSIGSQAAARQQRPSAGPLLLAPG